MRAERYTYVVLRKSGFTAAPIATFDELDDAINFVDESDSLSNEKCDHIWQRDEDYRYRIERVAHLVPCSA